MSNLINRPMTTTNTNAAAPMVAGSAPVMAGSSTPNAMGATPMLPGVASTAAGVMDNSHHHRKGEKLSWHEKRAVKHQEKATKHENKAHRHDYGLGPAGLEQNRTGLPLGGAAVPVVHGATNVIEHQPIVEREVLVERPVEVRREHHIQPVIHEREHQIQPVIRTEVTTERRDMLADRNVMLPAVVEQQPRMATAGMLHQTTTDHRGVLPGTTGATGAGMGAHHATIGQKIKGTVKEVQGSVTHNPIKKEEGRLLKQGIEPSTAAGLGNSTAGTTTRF